MQLFLSAINTLQLKFQQVKNMRLRYLQEQTLVVMKVRITQLLSVQCAVANFPGSPMPNIHNSLPLL